MHFTGPAGFDCRLKADYDLDRGPFPLDWIPGTSGPVTLGIKAAEGGLTFSANDDCYLVSGDGKVADRSEFHGWGNDEIDMPFPYLAKLAHWQGKFTVKAKYVCKHDQRLGSIWQSYCPELIELPLFVGSLSVSLHAEEVRDRIGENISRR